MKNVIIILLSVLMGTWASADEMKIYCDEAPPTNYTDEDGSVTGFTVGVVRELQRRVGNTNPILVYPWKRAYSLALEDPNIVLFTASRNADREDKFHWICHVTTRRSVLFSKAGSPLTITSLEDAKQVKRIGVLRGGNREQYLTSRGFTNLDVVTKEEQNLLKLLAGRIDLVFLSTLEAATLAKEVGASFEELEPKFTVYSNESYVMMSKPGTSLEDVQRWHDAAQSMKADGTFRRIAETWSARILEQYGVETEVRDDVLYFWKE